MSVSYADNAVLAKAHAMYGKRITKENYNDMLNCRSLGELVNYLKTRTCFSSDFDALPTNIDSAQIEEILKMSLLKNGGREERYLSGLPIIKSRIIIIICLISFCTTK